MITLTQTVTFTVVIGEQSFLITSKEDLAELQSQIVAVLNKKEDPDHLKDISDHLEDINDSIAILNDRVTDLEFLVATRAQESKIIEITKETPTVEPEPKVVNENSPIVTAPQSLKEQVLALTKIETHAGKSLAATIAKRLRRQFPNITAGEVDEILSSEKDQSISKEALKEFLLALDMNNIRPQQLIEFITDLWLQKDLADIPTGFRTPMEADHCRKLWQSLTNQKFMPVLTGLSGDELRDLKLALQGKWMVKK